MAFTPNIQVFCCHYTSSQALAESQQELAADGLPAGAAINRLACGGKLKVSTLLGAFEDGADGVCVVGCREDECHNLLGSQRAAHRVLAVKKALAELGVAEERLSFHHLPRGYHPEFVQAVQAVTDKVNKLGPSPFKGEQS
ncbi:MAG: hydrogenase iron-sulfur subunit [Desulfurivibrio sp.]|nr:hydrogenase iron-sulfur subunit [Desulfurivibrio sp.]